MASTNHRPEIRLEDIVRRNIYQLKPYRCARDDYSQGILLDANENSLGSALVSAQKQSASTEHRSEEEGHKLDLEELSLHRYPSPSHLSIKQNLCDYRNGKDVAMELPKLTPSNCFLGVGSDEVLDLLFRITCRPGDSDEVGDRVICTPPTYGMYTVCAKINDVGVINVPLEVQKGSFEVDIQKIEQIISEPTERPVKLIILCSPGNPTGTTIPLETMMRILENSNFKKGLLIVDEAYIDFTDSNKSAIQLIRKGYKNLVVTQTLSKGFGLAGIRLGIGWGSEELIQILNNTKAPYSVSSPSAALALKATRSKTLAKAEENIETLKQNRGFLKRELVKIPGMGPIIGSNEANFILIKVKKTNEDQSAHDDQDQEGDSERAKKVYKYMAELNPDEAIVVRYRGDDLGCQGCLRISIGSLNECEQLLERLRKTLEIV